MTSIQKYSVSIQDLNDRTQHGAILRRLQTTLPEVVSTPPFKELINLGANKGHLEAIVSVLVLKASNLLSTSGNLKEGQALEIAKNIIQDYPLMSLEDINLCLSNGAKGKYGQIFRFDISVIYDWIRAFEEEKAEFVEVIHKKEVKAEDSGPMSEETKKMLNEWILNLKGPIPKKVQYDVKSEKAASTGYKFGTLEDYRIIELKAEYGRIYADPYTGRPKSGSPTLKEFLASNGVF